MTGRNTPDTADGDPHEPEFDAVVREKTVVAEGVAELLLADPAGGELPAWEPGAHIDLVPAAGPVRQYSLCGDPADRSCYRVAVLREPAGRGGSAHVHDVLRPGDAVRIRGPRNHFALEPAPAYLFVAGGIGITPLLPMIAAAASRGAGWRLLYGGRSRRTMAFLDRLAVYGDRVRVSPQDTEGLLDLAGFLGTPAPGTLVYACGPEPMLDAVEGACAGFPGALRVERFAPKDVTRSTADHGFDVVLAQSGLTLTVPPGRTILECVEEAGVAVLSSCQEGTCGTCETDVLEGEPDHRDSVLGEADRAAGDTLMICVSRCRGSRLVLDL